MEKISGIVPAGRRFKNIDTSRAQPVRPGAPSFGRPVGRSSQADSIANIGPLTLPNAVDRVSLSEDAKLQAGDGESINEKAEISSRPRIEMSVYTAPAKPVVASTVEEMANRFFSPQKVTAEPIAQRDLSGSIAQQDLSKENPYSSSEQSL